jgi:hypothetical protein
MEKKLTFHVIDRPEETYDVPIFETDRFSDIETMAKNTINPEFPDFLLFPAKFKEETLNLKSSYNVVDLTKAKVFFANYRESRVTINDNLINFILRDYEVDTFELYEKLLILLLYYAVTISKLFRPDRQRTLPGMKKKAPKKEGKVVKKSYWLFFDEDVKRQIGYLAICISPTAKEEEKRRYELVVKANLEACRPIVVLLAKKLRRDAKGQSFIFEKAKSFAYANQRTKNILEERKKQIETTRATFKGLKGLSIQPLEENGKILILEIVTKNYSTGTIFDALELNEEFFQATYKGFQKVYENHVMEAVDMKGNDMCILRHEKRYVRKFTPEINENVQIYLKNIANGLEIQVLLLKSSSISTTEGLFRFLQMDESNFRIRHVHTRGIIGSCLIKNPKPVYLRHSDIWTSFQPSILANMIMNNDLFQQFLLINDSEKISRETPSNYVYFRNPLQKSDDTAVLVGGWNKLSSRFGSLTAVLYPLNLRGEDYIQVKILRSNDRQTVDDFLHIFSKLMAFYNEELTEEIHYFRHMNPEFQLKESKEEKISSKENSLPLLEPKIFTKKIWSRSCQKKNKPPIILDDITGKDPETIVKFPARDTTIDGTFYPSQYYHCYDDEYRYPGFIFMKSLEDKGQHPFGGYAPCCYKEDHSEKNQNVLAKLHALTLQNTEPDETVDIIFVKKNEIASENIINYMGQQGKLCSPIQNFLRSIDPRRDYVRIGLSSIWQRSSLIGCCQYILQKTKLKYIHQLEQLPTRSQEQNELISKKSFYEKMPLQKDLRNRILQVSMDVLAQETRNSVSIIDEIANAKYRLDVRDLLSLVQYYYKINLLVIDVEGNFVKPHSTFSYKIRFDEKNPLIVLLEHPNQVYEILARRTKDEIMFPMLNDCFPTQPYAEEWKFIYDVVYSTFQCDRYISATFDSIQTFIVEKNLSSQIEFQVLTGTGQTRIFLCNFRDKLIPLFMESSNAPCNLPTKDRVDMTNVDEDLVADFLETILPIKFKVVKKAPFTFFLVENLFQIPCRMGNRTKFLDVVYTPSVHFSPLTAILYKYLQPQRQTFDELFQLKHASLLIMDYLIIVLANFMSTEHPKEIVKKMISVDIDKLLESFIEHNIKFHNDENFHKIAFQPLFDQNPTLFYENKVQIPEQIRHKISFMLKWNLVNNWEFIKSQRKHQELPSYYQHVFQFQKRKNQSVQIKQQTFLNSGYQQYLETIESAAERPIGKIYFLLNRKSMVIIPCFVFHKNIEKIHTIMNQYFDAGRLSFEDCSEMNPPKYKFHIMTSKKIPDEVHAEEYYICAVERQYVVLLPFMTE